MTHNLGPPGPASTEAEAIHDLADLHRVTGFQSWLEFQDAVETRLDPLDVVDVSFDEDGFSAAVGALNGCGIFTMSEIEFPFTMVGVWKEVTEVEDLVLMDEATAAIVAQAEAAGGVVAMRMDELLNRCSLVADESGHITKAHLDVLTGALEKFGLRATRLHTRFDSWTLLYLTQSPIAQAMEAAHVATW